MVLTNRYWCWTLNNPTSFPNFQEPVWNNYVTFAVAMLEIGENGTPHLQGYLETKNPTRLTWFKKRGRMPTAHLEKRRGKKDQAIAYCLKTLQPDSPENPAASIQSFLSPHASPTHSAATDVEIPLGQLSQTSDTTSCNTVAQESPPLIAHPTPTNVNAATLSTRWSLNGSPPVYLWGSEETAQALAKRCKKTRISTADQLEQVREKIEAGATHLQIAREHFPLWVRYQKAFSTYAAVIRPQRDHVTEVIIIYGPTGTGKTRYAKDNFPDAYWKQRSVWWCGYDGQDTVVLDEFYGWLPYSTLLRICDRYPLLMETKGGQVNFTAKTIVFTTNSLPHLWYRTNFQALARRVSKWLILHTLNEPPVELSHYDYDIFNAHDTRLNASGHVETFNTPP